MAQGLLVGQWLAETKVHLHRSHIRKHMYKSATETEDSKTQLLAAVLCLSLC